MKKTKRKAIRRARFRLIRETKTLKLTRSVQREVFLSPNGHTIRSLKVHVIELQIKLAVALRAELG